MTIEKTAVPLPSVGAGGEQPIPKVSEQSITDENLKNNPSDEGLEEMYRQRQRLSDPAYRLIEQTIKFGGCQAVWKRFRQKT